MDKNEAMISYLLNCPIIQTDPLFFNFINAKDDTNQIVTERNDIALQQPFIDGSVLKMYAINLIVFKSVSQNAVVKASGYPDENITDLASVQTLIDWIAEQAELQNFPDFGEDCIVDSIRTLTNNPVLDVIDTSVNPPLARYSVMIQVEYLDISKKVWK